MSDYTRTTRECSVSQLHPSLSQAVQEYLQTHPLGYVDAGTLLCCEITSKKRDHGKFVASLASFLEGNPDTTTHLAILLTEEWLIWARNGDRSGTVITAAMLNGIQVKAFTSRRSKEMELEVSAFIGDSKDFVRGNLTMGPEMAAQKFCEKVVQAVTKINPPKKSKFPRWMGG